MQRDDGAQPPHGGAGPLGGDFNDPLIGRILDGRYRIGTRIARGGMASVYEAADLRLDRTVAVKVMHAGLGDNGEFAERFVREAHAAARISHPNVVAVYDQGDDNGVVFLAMELIEGHTLRDVIREEAPLSPARSLAFFEPIVAALAAAHRAGLIHRDIKPENVLIAEDGRIKVADFGLAKAVSADTQHTATGGVLIGTVSYLAPELVVDGRADARADVYAAGVMLYEMLTGLKPHDGETPIQVAYKHVHEDVPPPSELAPRVPAYVDALVARATSRVRTLRPADATVLLHQVRRVAQALAEGVVDDPELVADLTPIKSRAVSAEAPTPDDTQPSLPVVPETDDISGDVPGDVSAEQDDWADEEPEDEADDMARGGSALGGVAAGAAVAAATYNPDVPYDQESDAPFSFSFSADDIPDDELAAAFVPVERAEQTGEQAGAYPAGDGASSNYPLFADEEGMTRPRDDLGQWGGPTPEAWDPSTGHAEATTPISNFGAHPDLDTWASATPAATGVRPPPPTGPPAPPKQRRKHRWRGPLLVALAVLLIAGAATGAWWFGIGRYTTAPGVLNLPEAEAIAKLEKAGLEVEQTDPVYSEQVPKGQVIESDPKAGAKILRGSTITLTISLGKERYRVPKLIGLTEDKAQDRIAESHLTFGKSKHVFSETVAKGRVISSTPKRGVKLKKDSEVDLVVSKGRRPINFIDWTGKPAADAKAALTKKGLKVDDSAEEYSDTIPEGYVISQSPTSGPLHLGDKVTLVVSKGPEMIEIPRRGVLATPVDQAKQTLIDLGFEVKVKKADDYLGWDLVKSTDPPAGSSAPKGSTITLYKI